MLYGILLWGKSDNVDKIAKLQKRAIRAWAPAGGGQEGALAPPGNSQIWGAPQDNLMRNFLKKIKGTPYSKRRN